MISAGGDAVAPPPGQADPVPPPPSSALGEVLTAPLLLQGQDYFFRAPSTCLDFQERMYAAELVDEGSGDTTVDPQPCVLVLARAADMEMNELSLALAERDIRLVRIDADRCLDLPLTVYPDAPLVELGNRLLRPLLVWRRHFDIAAVPADGRSLRGAYAIEQWTAVSDWLSVRRDWCHVNSPRHTRNLDRLSQLDDAASFGLRVPRTAVTTRPARNRPGGGRCLVKTAGRHLLEPRPGALHGLFPRPLDPSRSRDVVEPAPVIVQQHLDAEEELRVFVVGGELIAYRVRKLDPAQLWQDPDAVTVEAVETPRPLAATLLALVRHWRLDIAAFDLLVVEGEPVFLEVNVNCDWRWFEYRAEDTRVSRATHEWVASRFQELRGASEGR
ncbi:ATP-grasp domain-containing protein [Actinoalloteichus caeruleus]|uniref:ATP-grasp domain-containing protein n=1 Tax=Actinoalloteichus cyanogriseus TaxID=2893586 RepID=UPI003BB8B58A